MPLLCFSCDLAEPKFVLKKVVAQQDTSYLAEYALKRHLSKTTSETEVVGTQLDDTECLQKHISKGQCKVENKEKDDEVQGEGVSATGERVGEHEARGSKR